MKLSFITATFFRSNYKQWATELSNLLQKDCYTLTETDVNALNQLVQNWQNKQVQNESIPAFDYAAKI